MTYPTHSAGSTTLRETIESDLPTFFEYQLDPEANQRAAFTDREPTDRLAFDTQWAKIMVDPRITVRTILYDDKIAGCILSFPSEKTPELGYWLGKQYWGKGIATSALAQFLEIITTRPVYASTAADNISSVRVLEKCGFKLTGYRKDFAMARGEEIDEALFRLD